MSKSNVSLTDFRIRYPDLIDYDDEDSVKLLLTFIEDAEQDVSVSIFGDLRDRAIIAQVAHRTTLRLKEIGGEENVMFPLSQVSGGDLSGTFVTPPPDGTLPERLHYYTTQAGTEYITLLRRMNSGVRTVGSG